jgi:two-component system NarL family sensor kinase
VRVNIWDARGRVVYSDSTQLIGSMFPLGQDELRMVRGGGAKADASDLTRPENRSERGFDRLLEVYVGIPYSLARRLRSRQREREELLRRAIDASDLERRRIAADLHDGAVQRLAGVSLSLAAAGSTAACAPRWTFPGTTGRRAEPERT